MLSVFFIDGIPVFLNFLGIIQRHTKLDKKIILAKRQSFILFNVKTEDFQISSFSSIFGVKLSLIRTMCLIFLMRQLFDYGIQMI